MPLDVIRVVGRRIFLPGFPGGLPGTGPTRGGVAQGEPPETAGGDDTPLIEEFVPGGDGGDPPDPILPNITVTGQRISGSSPFSAFAGMNLAAAEMQTRIAENAARGGTLFRDLIRGGQTDFQRLMSKPVNPRAAAPLSEVKVIAKRAGRFNFASLILAIGGELGAAIAMDISQGRLDEAWFKFQRIPTKPNRDTKVKTIKKIPLDNILVRGKRRFPRQRVPGTERQAFENFQPEPFAQLVGDPPRVTLPTLFLNPRLQPKPKPKPKLQPFAFRQPFGLPQFDTETRTKPRPFPKTRTLPEPKTDLTRPKPDGVTSRDTRFARRPFAAPFPQTQTESKCAPCPKPTCKKEKEKKRTTCYRKLVKEGITPSKDTEFRWTKIDCKTKKEM